MTRFIFMVALCLIKCGFIFSVTVYNPYFHFPGGSEPFMGIIVTVAVPVEAGTPGEVLLSAILEGNYVIPTNETEYEYPPDYVESSERTFLYEFLIRKIEDFGYPGKQCLLRAICEVSEISSINTSILGDIVHLLLTPSTSIKEKKLKEYEEAESSRKTKGCQNYKKLCPYTIIDAISKINLL